MKISIHVGKLEIEAMEHIADSFEDMLECHDIYHDSEYRKDIQKFIRVICKIKNAVKAKELLYEQDKSE